MPDRIHWNAEGVIKTVCKVLSSGGIIVYPTDTLYGFGCDAKNEIAIQKLNKIKNRRGPISVLAPSKKSVSDWLSIPQKYKNEVLEKIGGPKTVIVPIKTGIVSKNIIANNNTLGIRIPDHPFCHKISNTYENPITTTSVNRTGQEPLFDPDLIEHEFHNEIELIIEDGIIKGVGSSILFFEELKWKVLR